LYGKNFPLIKIRTRSRWGRLALEIHFEVDGAHDSVGGFFTNQLLEGRAADADQFTETVEERVSRVLRPERSRYGVVMSKRAASGNSNGSTSILAYSGL
jgi:hypothetical protein